MIRVNLLGSKVSGTAAASFGVPAASSEGEREVIQKLFIMFLLTGALYCYEFYNIDQLQTKNRNLSSELSVLHQQVAAKKKFADEAKAMQQQIIEIEDKIKIIKQLSKLRLRELKALDTLQTIIPEKLWFQSMTYNNQNLELKGYALEDEDLTLFLRAMQEKPYFSQVILKRAQDQKVQDGILKEFYITCNVEAGD